MAKKPQSLFTSGFFPSTLQSTFTRKYKTYYRQKKKKMFEERKLISKPDLDMAEVLKWSNYGFKTTMTIMVKTLMEMVKSC